MEQGHEKKLKEFIGDLVCPKAFKCCTEGLENLCKAEELGPDLLLECIEDNPPACLFALHFGDRYYCECPLRIYISEKLKK
jgi:hypothetical protein